VPAWAHSDRTSMYFFKYVIFEISHGGFG
jgi:hypothetical protein